MTQLSSYYIANDDDIDENSSPEDIEIDHEAIKDRFGSKNPTDSTYWDTVWEKANLDRTEPIYRERLPGALQHANGIRGSQAADAVQLGIASGQLIPTGEDALRLPGPRDNYHNYIVDEDLADIQRREHWTGVWNTLGRDETENIGVSFIIMGLRSEHGYEKPMAQATIGAGVDAGVIKEDGKKLELGERTVPAFWSGLLNEYNAQTHEPLTHNELTLGLRMVHDLTDDRADDCIDTGLEHGILYQQADSDRYRINTPRDEQGPDIAEEAFSRDAYPPSEDGDVSGSDGDDDDPDSGDETENPNTDTETSGADSTRETGTSHIDDDTTTSDADEKGDGPATGADPEEPDSEQATSDSSEPDGVSSTDSDTHAHDATETASESGNCSQSHTAAHSESDTDGDDDEQPPDADSTDTDAESDTQIDTDETRPIGHTEDGEPHTEPNSTLTDKDPDDLRLKPTPDLGAVQACLEEAARFFHAQLDESIDQNVAWNEERAFEEGYRMPETPREYFTSLNEPDPAYPVEQDPDAADAMPSNKDAQTSGIQSTEDAADNTGDHLVFAAADQPYQYLGADHRGWSDELVDDKQLGWAPAYGQELFFHLEAQGFERHTMLATGLFVKPDDAYGENEEGEGYVDYTTIDNPDDPADLSCLFRGRYIFPYYDEDGKVAFFIGRRPDFDTKHGTHPDDFTKGKYAKLATTKNYTIADEPIYGRETIVDGQPLAITEGMADAITAHAHGIPCISPVTKSFKMKHRDVLADIIKRREIPDVYFLQDSDPPKRVVLTEQDQDHDERRTQRDMNIREAFCTGEFPGNEMFTKQLVLTAARDGTLQDKLDDQDIQVAPPVDPDRDTDEQTPVTAEEVPVHLFETDGEFRATGPISEAIELHQHGPGVDSAVNMGRVLDTHTPPSDDTFTGTVQTAAAVYREEVLEGDADPLEDDHELWKEVATRLGMIDVDTETDETTKSADEDGQASLVPDSEDEPAHTDYGGTNVWIIELPQFGDEKRDLDDFLQEGWLALTPPADWALRLTMGNGPATDRDATDAPSTPPAWMQTLADRADPVADYPTGMAPESLSFPTANDLPQTVGAIPGVAQADDFPTYDPYIIASDPDADSDALRASHRWPVSDATTLRKAGNLLHPVPETEDMYPPLSLFGFIPTIHPSQHPAASGNVGGLVGSGSGSEMEIDPQELEDRIDENDYRQLTGDHNPLWSLDLRDLGLTPGSRGKNPFGHFGESENYFVVIDDETAYCHKREALYNFQHFALCDMGKRDPADSASGQTLDDLEYLHLWTYARQNNLIPEHTPIPLKGLVGYAIEHNFCEPDDLEQFSPKGGEDDADDDAETDESTSADTTGKRNLKLPDTIYFPVLKHIEGSTGYTPARLASSDSSGGEQTGKGAAPDVDVADIAFERANDRYGGYLESPNYPEPLKQFLHTFTESESGEIVTDTDECMFVPKAQLRDAYNAWAQINLMHVRKNTDTNPDEVDIEVRHPGAFTGPMKQAVDIDLKDGRPELENGDRPTVWYGITLTNMGKDLAELEGKFGLDD